MNNYNQVFTDTLHTNNVISENNIINIGNKSNDKSNIETNINNNEDTLNIDNINLKNNITFKDENYTNGRFFKYIENFILDIKPLHMKDGWDPSTWKYSTTILEVPQDGFFYYSLSTCTSNYIIKHALESNPNYTPPDIISQFIYEDTNTFLENSIYYYTNSIFYEIIYSENNFSASYARSYPKNSYYLSTISKSQAKNRVLKMDEPQPSSPTEEGSYVVSSNIKLNKLYYIYYNSSTSSTNGYAYDYQYDVIYYDFSALQNNKFLISKENYDNTIYTVTHINNIIDNNIYKDYIYKFYNNELIELPFENNLIIFIKLTKTIYIYINDKWMLINSGIDSFMDGKEVFNDYINNIASGNYSHAEGFNTIAQGNYSHAEGYITTAQGNYSHAEGSNCKSTSTYTHAEGYTTTASASSAHSEGYSTKSTGSYSHSEGRATTASGTSAHAEGYGSVSSGSYSHAAGYYTYADKSYMTAIGKYNVYNKDDTTLNNGKLFVVGNGTDTAVTSRNDAFIVKDTGDVIVQTSLITPEIKTNTAVSSTEGNITTNEYSLNIGKKSTNKANIITTIEEENNSGTITINNEYDTLNIDKINTSSLKLDYELIGVQRSTNPGNDDKLIATKAYVLENSGSGGSDIGQLYPGSTHGEIFNEYSNNVASGNYSHAEGGYTHAEGNYSHAEGNYTYALSNYSSTSGYYTYSNQPYMFVVGKYNLYDQNHPEYNVNKLFVVGNGDQNTRSDAFVVKDDGSVLITDKIIIDNIIQSSLKYGNITLKDNSNNEVVKLNALNGLTLNTNKSVNDIQLSSNTSDNDNKILTTKAYVNQQINNIDLSGYVQKNTQNTIGADHIFSGNLTLSGTNTFSGSSNTFNNVINTNGGIKTNTSNTDLNLSASSNNINMNTNNNTTTISFDVSNGKISNNKVIMEKSGSSNISGQIVIKDKNDNNSIILNGDNGITLNGNTVKNIAISTDSYSSTLDDTKLTTKGYIDDELSGKANLNGADFTGNISTSGTITSTGLITANNGLSIPSNKLLSLNSKSVNDIELGTDTTNNNIITTKSYVDEQINNIDLSNYVTKTTTQTDISGQKTFSNPSNSFSGSFNGSLTTSSITLNSKNVTDIQKSSNSTTYTDTSLSTKGYVDEGLSDKITKNVDDLTNYTTTTNADNRYIRKDQDDTDNNILTLSTLKMKDNDNNSNYNSITTIVKGNSNNTILTTKGYVDDGLSNKLDTLTYNTDKANFVTTNTSQDISGQKTFTSAINANSGITTTNNNNLILSSSATSNKIQMGNKQTNQTELLTSTIDQSIQDTFTTDNISSTNLTSTNIKTNTIKNNDGTIDLIKYDTNKVIVGNTSNEINIGGVVVNNDDITADKLTIKELIVDKIDTQEGKIAVEGIDVGTITTLEPLSQTVKSSITSSGINSAKEFYVYSGDSVSVSNKRVIINTITSENTEYGNIDIRDNSGNSKIQLNGSNGQITTNSITSNNSETLTITSANNIINLGSKSSNKSSLTTDITNNEDTLITDIIKANDYKFVDDNYTNNKTLEIDDTIYEFILHCGYSSSSNKTFNTNEFYKIIDNTGNITNNIVADTYYTYTTNIDIENNGSIVSDIRFYQPMNIDFESKTINDFSTGIVYRPITARRINTSDIPFYNVTSETYNVYSSDAFYKYDDNGSLKLRLISSTNYSSVNFNYYKIDKYYLAYTTKTNTSNPKYIIKHTTGTINNTTTENYIYKCTNINYETSEFTFEELPLENKLIIIFKDYCYMYINGWRCISIGNMNISNMIISFNNIKYNENFNNNCTSSGFYSHAEGYETTASGNQSHAEGYDTTASSYDSHAEGTSTLASGFYSHAEGYSTTASGNGSHAQGYITKAMNIATHTEGYYTRAVGAYSHAEGYHTVAIGIGSHAEGYTTQDPQDNPTISTTTYYAGNYAHSEGYNTKASGESSHAEGRNTISSGNYSHAEGSNTTASSSQSHAEGSNTIASGTHSHAENYYTTALGNYSHTSGYYTIADKPSMFVCGKYNIYDSSQTTLNDNKLFVVGNGTADNARSDAFVVYNNGEVKINSTASNTTPLLTIGTSRSIIGTTTTSTDTSQTGDNILATKYYVDTQISSAEGNYYLKNNKVDISNSGSGSSEKGIISVKYYNNNRILLDGNTGFILYQLNSNNERVKINTTSNNSGNIIVNKVGGYQVVTLDGDNGIGVYYPNNSNKKVLINTTGSSTSASYGNIEVKDNNNTNKIVLNGETGLTLGTSLPVHSTTATTQDNNEKILATKYYVDSNNIGKLYPETTHGEIFNDYDNNKATGNYSHAEGTNTVALGNHSHAEGYHTVAFGNNSHAEGSTNQSIPDDLTSFTPTYYAGLNAHCEGYNTKASGEASHAEGFNTKATAIEAHAEGYATEASGRYSHSGGDHTIANSKCLTAIGQFNTNDGYASDVINRLFVVGNGTTINTRSDAFVVYNNGNAYVQNNLFVGEEVDSNGSDYAELFESYNNLTKDDFKGKFITLEEDDKVRIANNNDDYILGVYSFHPSVLGNNPIDYPDKYLRNEFTEIIYEDVKQLKQEFININNKKNNNIDLTDDEIKLNNIKEDKYEIIKKPKLNDKYNDKLKYIQRKDRDNWIPVGMLGKLLVIDNGTCKVNSYCKINFDGTAIPYDRKDGNIPHYRVIKRNNDKTIFIIFK